MDAPWTPRQNNLSILEASFDKNRCPFSRSWLQLFLESQRGCFYYKRLQNKLVLQIQHQNYKIIKHLASNFNYKLRTIYNEKSQRFRFEVGTPTLLTIILLYAERFPLQEKLQNKIIRVKFLLEIKQSNPNLFKKLSERLNLNEYINLQEWKTKYS